MEGMCEIESLPIITIKAYLFISIYSQKHLTGYFLIHLNKFFKC